MAREHLSKESPPHRISYADLKEAIGSLPIRPKTADDYYDCVKSLMERRISPFDKKLQFTVTDLAGDNIYKGFTKSVVEKIMFALEKEGYLQRKGKRLQYNPKYAFNRFNLFQFLDHKKNRHLQPIYFTQQNTPHYPLTEERIPDAKFRDYVKKLLHLRPDVRGRYTVPLIRRICTGVMGEPVRDVILYWGTYFFRPSCYEEAAIILDRMNQSTQSFSILNELWNGSEIFFEITNFRVFIGNIRSALVIGDVNRDLQNMNNEAQVSEDQHWLCVELAAVDSRTRRIQYLARFQLNSEVFHLQGNRIMPILFSNRPDPSRWPDDAVSSHIKY